MRRPREDYVSAVWTYKKRRLALREKYVKWRTNSDYAFLCYNLSLKISLWQAAIRRIDKRNITLKEKLSPLIKSINEYFNVRIQDKSIGRKHNLARNIYYKIALEKGIKGIYIGKAINRSKKRAAKGRQALTLSFKTNQASKTAYTDFKKYFE